MPGTTTKKDRETDFMARLAVLDIPGVSRKKCRRCRAHHGFQKAWDSLARTAARALDRNLKQHPSYKVVITGHSLGAGLASLATASLRGLGYPIKATFTMGEPRVGNRRFAEYIDKITGSTEKSAGSYYRITHANDNVPHHPVRSFGYVHSRTEFWERNTKSGGQSAHTTFRCFGMEPKDCNDSTKSKKFINAAHLTYTGILMEGPQSCGG